MGRAKPATSAEKRRMTILKESVPCICCLVLGKVRLPEIHHAVSGMRREGHNKTVSLCPWHHRSIPLDNWQKLDGAEGGANQATSGLLGPSLAHGKRTFQEFFGSEHLLVLIATRLVKSYEESPWHNYDIPYDLKRKVIEYWEANK